MVLAGDGAAISDPAASTEAFSPRSPVRPGADPADQVESLYLTHRRLLLYVGCVKFGVPEEDAEALLQEIFVSFMESAPQIVKVRAWLVAAMCNASRHYWRVRGRVESLPSDVAEKSDPSSHEAADKWATRISLQQAIGYLQPRCRETLFLHYYEGRSASDVARELDTTLRYAEKLIHNCLKRVREIYLKMMRVTR